MLGFHSKRDILVQQELEKDDQHDGQELDKAAAKAHLVDADPQDEIAEHQAAQADGQKHGKAADGFVLHLEIVGSVQKETGGDADQHRDAVRQEIVQPDMFGQKGENNKIECRREASDDAVENQVAELPVKGSNHVHFYKNVPTTTPEIRQ